MSGIRSRLVALGASALLAGGLLLTGCGGSGDTSSAVTTEPGAPSTTRTGDGHITADTLPSGLPPAIGEYLAAMNAHGFAVDVVENSAAQADTGALRVFSAGKGGGRVTGGSLMVFDGPEGAVVAATSLAARPSTVVIRKGQSVAAVPMGRVARAADRSALRAAIADLRANGWR